MGLSLGRTPKKFITFATQVFDTIHGYDEEHAREIIKERMDSMIAKGLMKGDLCEEKKNEYIECSYRGYLSSRKLFIRNLYVYAVYDCLSDNLCMEAARWTNKYTKTETLFWDLLELVKYHCGTKEKSAIAFINNLTMDDFNRLIEEKTQFVVNFQYVYLGRPI